MSANTSIAWCDHTFNLVWGCTKVSPGCDVCYAASIARRSGVGWGQAAERKRLGDATWRQPLAWDRRALADLGRPARVFCGSMCDVFEHHPTVAEERLRLWELIRRTPNLRWLLLTKRPRNIERNLPDDWAALAPRVWLGTSIECDKYAWRAEAIKAIRAAVHFVSYEPALGPLDSLDLTGLDWIIYGAESGAHFRKHDLAWARAMRDRCRAAGVAFFYKQDNGRRDGTNPHLDGEKIQEWPSEPRGGGESMSTTDTGAEHGREGDAAGAGTPEPARRLIETARLAHRCGLRVLPPKQDGSKAPDGGLWKRAQEQMPLERELEVWCAEYANGVRTGIGYVCGAVSGNLEVLDFDEPGVHEAFRERARECGLAELLERVEAGYLEATPREPEGHHLPYRCETIAGNQPLARRPKRPEEMRDEHDKVQVKIETRGEGGFVVAAPSFGRVHETGKPYRLLRGGLETIATIAPEEREALLELARSFDEMPRRQAHEEPPPADEGGEGLRPGDDYNRRATWPEVLEPHGWRPVSERGGESYWRRPGKAIGISATTNYQGSDLLYVFSTSTPLETERGYSKFAAYAVLEHEGDFKAAARDLAARGYGSHPEGERKTASTCSDVANAHRLARAFRDELRWVRGIGWCTWDPTRGLWRTDDEEGAAARAQRLGRIVSAEAAKLAAEAAGCADEEKRAQLQLVAKARLGWAKASEMQGRVVAALEGAKPHLAVEVAALDANPDLLHCRNGTLDLATLTLRAHRPEDLLTKTTGVEYDPSARSKLWDDFLEKVLPTEAVRSFAQSYLGYALLGRPVEDKMVIAHGGTRTGKGTFEGACMAALGDYAMTADFSTLAAREPRPGQTRSDLVRLRGARLVLIYETGRDLRMDADLVKQLCGSDPIVARTLFKEEIEFTPRLSLILATNHRPRVPDDDDAIWERLVEIPFTVFIPETERDETIRTRLRDPAESGAAVLAWMVAGLRAYRAKGLVAPKVVVEATAAYRSEMDTIGEFLDEHCRRGADLWISAAILRQTYEIWARMRGERALVGKAWGDGLRRHGLTPEPRGHEKTRGWRGVALLGPDEADADVRTRADASSAKVLCTNETLEPLRKSRPHASARPHARVIRPVAGPARPRTFEDEDGDEDADEDEEKTPRARPRKRSGPR